MNTLKTYALCLALASVSTTAAQDVVVRPLSADEPWLVEVAATQAGWTLHGWQLETPDGQLSVQFRMVNGDAFPGSTMMVEAGDRVCVALAYRQIKARDALKRLTAFLSDGEEQQLLAALPEGFAERRLYEIKLVTARSFGEGSGGRSGTHVVLPPAWAPAASAGGTLVTPMLTDGVARLPVGQWASLLTRLWWVHPSGDGEVSTIQTPTGQVLLKIDGEAVALEEHDQPVWQLRFKFAPR